MFINKFLYFLTFSQLFLQLSFTDSTHEDVVSIEIDAATGSQQEQSQSQSYKYSSSSQSDQTQEQAEEQARQANKREENRVRPQSTAAGIKIKNPRDYAVDYYWWSGTECIYQGRIKPRGVTATNSYIGHTFIFTKKRNKQVTNCQDYEFDRITVVNNVNLYVLSPEPGQENDEHYLELMKELEFMQDYLKRTGRPWLAHYPRDPPIHHIWPADFIGQKHSVITNATHWICIPEHNPPMPEEISKCHPSPPDVSPLTITLEVISMEPKIFAIKNTLSDIEADLIIDLAKPKIKRSLAGSDGGLVSNTRTSSNAWLGRSEHYILDTIYRRAADIVNISETLFMPGNINNIVEDMQVVNYKYQQEYTPHHDFGADGRPNQRYITLLFYLNEQISNDAGGETSFPKAGVNPIHAGKGNSVMFYSLLEDGNADDLSLHAGTPVKKGEKWLANFWVWDPKR